MPIHLSDASKEGNDAHGRRRRGTDRRWVGFSSLTSPTSHPSRRNEATLSVLDHTAAAAAPRHRGHSVTEHQIPSTARPHIPATTTLTAGEKHHQHISHIQHGQEPHHLLAVHTAVATTLEPTDEEPGRTSNTTAATPEPRTRAPPEFPAASRRSGRRPPRTSPRRHLPLPRRHLRLPRRRGQEADRQPRPPQPIPDAACAASPDRDLPPPGPGCAAPPTSARRHEEEHRAHHLHHEPSTVLHLARRTSPRAASPEIPTAPPP